MNVSFQLQDSRTIFEWSLYKHNTVNPEEKAILSIINSTLF